MFRSARKLGLLNEHCFGPDDHIVLLDASRFMAGLNVMYNRSKGDEGVRWGNAGGLKDGRGGDYIFPSNVADIIKNILNYSSSDSHTEEDEQYLIDEDSKEVFFGYVMQLCYVLRWYGTYAQEHNNIKTNLAMHKPVPAPSKEKTKDTIAKVTFISAKVNKEDAIGKEFMVLQEKNFYCAGSCKISSELKSQIKPFTKVRIHEVENNTDKDCERYPFIATKVESV